MPAQKLTGKHRMASLSVLHQALAQVINDSTSGSEDRATAIPNLLFFRREEQTEPCECLIEPSIVLVAQGAKQLLIGEQAYAYNPERFLITSLDLPASSQVLDASHRDPCLGLVFKLDLRLTAELIAASGLQPPRGRVADGSAALGTLTSDLLDPFVRLVSLLSEPEAISILAPLIEREIHYRLLTSDLAARLWQVAAVGSHSQRVAKAIDWLKNNYRIPLRIDELAAHVQMSASSLHHHFRQLTAMSPLQYQKWMRLNEARRLMLNERQDAASAAFLVGYESPSQFSREYGRMFGSPPKRDIEALRQKTAGATNRAEHGWT